MPRPPAKRRRRRGVRGVVVRGFVALSKRIGLLDAWGGDFSRRLALCSYRAIFGESGAWTGELRPLGEVVREKRSAWKY
jgi:hypothetical protein